MPKTDDDVLRELLHRATDDLHAPPAVSAGIVTRHHRRLRNTRIVSITTTGVAAAALVAAVAVTQAGSSAPGHAQHPAAQPATKLPPVTLTAVQVLDQLSVAAGRAQEPTGRYIALTEKDPILGAGYEKMSVIDSLTGDLWMYQRGGGAPSSVPVITHWSPTRTEFASWPTNPAKLRALLISQGVQAQAGVVTGASTTDDLVFQEATNWLWNPLLSPALRAAMYKVLAATPGVTVETGTTDSIGRPAIEISRRDSDLEYTTFESPSTGAVLEQDYGFGRGDVYAKEVYTGITGYAALPANPYGGR